MSRRETNEKQSVSVKGEDIEELTLSIISIIDQGVNAAGIRDDDKTIMTLLTYMGVLNFLPHGLPVRVVDKQYSIDIAEELEPNINGIEHIIRLSPRDKRATKRVQKIASKIGSAIDEYLLKFESINPAILGHIPAAWSIIMIEILKQSEYDSIAVLFPAKDKEGDGQRGYLTVYLKRNL